MKIKVRSKTINIEDRRREYGFKKNTPMSSHKNAITTRPEYKSGGTKSFLKQSFKRARQK